MHIKLLASIPFICLSVIGAIPDMEGFPFTPYFNPIGPFQAYEKNCIFSGYYIAGKSKEKIRERMIAGEDLDNPIYVETKKAHDVSKNDRVDLTFTLPFAQILGPNGVKCKFQVINSSGESLNSLTFNIRPISPTKINPKFYLTSYYAIDDIVIDPDTYQYEHQEKFIFDRFIDYFNTDTYYRIDLRSLSMYYSSPRSFPGATAYLRFEDYQKVFPYLDNDGEISSFDIPLEVVNTYNRISFKFAKSMYVKPETLEMSFNARPGFKLTNYFYLPINKSDELLNQVFTLKVVDFGYGKTSFDWDIRYINNRHLIGGCDNSDYCVKGEII